MGETNKGMTLRVELQVQGNNLKITKNKLNSRQHRDFSGCESVSINLARSTAQYTENLVAVTRVRLIRSLTILGDKENRCLVSNVTTFLRFSVILVDETSAQVEGSQRCKVNRPFLTADILTRHTVEGKAQVLIMALTMTPSISSVKMHYTV